MALPVAKLNQLNPLEIGHTIQVGGVAYTDREHVYLCMLPEEAFEGRELVRLELDLGDWKAVLRQTDVMETEVLAHGVGGEIVKAIIRKSTRQIEEALKWKVFDRDRYRCRYCGKGPGIPLTVDHLVTWEDGGPTIEENLVACCRKCNKARGNMPYGEWLKHAYYLKVSRDLQPNFRKDNENALHTLPDIPRRYHLRSRS